MGPSDSRLSDLIAPLRPGVGLSGPPTAPDALYDSEVARRIRVTPLMAALAAVLDRPQPLREVLARARVPEEERAAAESGLVNLDRMLLLDNDRARDGLAHWRAARHWTTSADTAPLITLPDARFTCTACGSCCGGHNIGPVESHVQTLLASEEGQTLLEEMDVPDGDPFTRRSDQHSDDVTAHFDGADQVVAMRSVEGSCVMLMADARCRLHARFGAASKPFVCRLFPWNFVFRPDGVAVSVETECRDLLRATEGGERMADQEPLLRTLLALPGPKPHIIRPILLVDGVATLPYPRYAALRDELLRQLEEPTAAPLASLLEAWTAIERTATAYAEGARAEVTRLDDIAALRETLHETVQRLGGALVGLRRELFESGRRRVVRLDALDLVLGGLSALVPKFARVVASPQDPDARALFRLFVRNALIGERLTTSRSLRHGFTRIVLTWLLARAVALDRARGARRYEPSAQEHLDGLAAVGFVLRSRHTAETLAEHSGPLSLLLYDHLSELLDHAPALAVRDERVEFYLG